MSSPWRLRTSVTRSASLTLTSRQANVTPVTEGDGECSTVAPVEVEEEIRGPPIVTYGLLSNRSSTCRRATGPWRRR